MRTDVDEAPLKSSVHQDDEVALKWAALERLPTYDRLRRGVLLGLHGRSDEIDVKNLEIDERKALVERLIKTVDENEKLLLNLKDRFERGESEVATLAAKILSEDVVVVGIELPTIEVRFEHLNVEVEAYVGTRAASTIPNFVTNLAVGFLHILHVLPSQKKHAQILQNVTGAIKSGRLTLLLGPPSSGKTTFLLALAGRLDRDLKVSGNVTYNGHGMHELVPQRTAAYVSQYDIHLSELTVRENLAFSARCQGVGSRYEALAELSRREKEAGIQPDPDVDMFLKAVGTEALKDNLVVDYILKILGLEVCADTFVGNEMIRGISGGEKKRLTTGEMLVGPARALFMDEISTGLDSSTTFQIVNAIRQYIHILKGTAVISLLQPPPETYSLFDDIILLSDGQIVYQGPCENVLEFFSYMGFECPKRKAVADFLQEVTSKKDQGQYWGCKDKPYSFVTVKEFGEAFQSFHIGHRLFEELKIPYDKSKSHPAALTTRKYYVRKMELFKTCFSRECLLMKRNAFVHIFKLFQLTISAVMAMTIFLRTRMHKDSLNGGTLYMAALFYNAFRMVFIEISEVSFVVLKLPTFYKQRDLLFFPTWAYALSDWILKLPLTFLATAIWVFMTYYVIGFDPDVGRMFKQYLLLFLVYQMASGLFRFIGAAGRNMIVAQTLGSNVLLLFTVLGGFVLSRENLSKWWIWGYWMSPMMYAQNGIAVNEFLGKSWIRVLPNTTEPLGVIVLKTVGLFPSAYWYWLSVGALAGFSILFNFLYTLALTFLDPPGKPRGVLIENSSSDREERACVTTTAVFLESVPSVKAECYSNHPVETRRGMILPFERHCITFNDVRYYVDMPKEMKNQGAIGNRLELLKGLSGAFRPGVLTALMGVTGAGKTTLLDVLAGRKTGGYIEGEIMISGYPKKQETFTRISGYCEQNDVHSPHITIYESLFHSAWLRLSPDVKYETRQMLVEEIMELVELTPLRDVLVGLPGINGLSTEQRKRLTIAVELVANPSIIFMDEPTSGLDARSAAIVMRTVRNTVDTGRTVVCTIHQPSIDIFESFDELFLMKLGGEEIYVGPLGHYSCDLIKYFEGIQGVEKIKNGQNPAAWMLDVTTPAQELRLGVDFAEIYKNSVEYRRTKALVQELSSPSQGSKELSFVSQYPQSFFIQLKACLWKQRCSYWHNPKYTALRLVDTVFVALLLGSIFWGIGSKRRTSQDLFNSMGSIYAAILFLGIRNAMFIQTVIFVERTVFYRERAAGMYPALPHTLAQITIEIPYNLTQTILYSLTVYAMVGYEWVASKVLWFMFFMFFTFLYHTFFGMVAVSMTPNPTFSSIISAFFISVWNLFSGFIVPEPVIPIWWKWNYWACPMAWSLYGLVTSQYGDVKELLEDGVSVQQYLGHGFGYRYDFLGTIAVGVVGYTILFAIVFVFCLKMFNFQKR